MKECSTTADLSVVEEIRAANQTLDDLLSADGHLSAEDIDSVSFLVLRRGELLNELAQRQSSPAARRIEESENGDKEYWISFYTELREHDSKRLALMRNKVEFAASAIRNSMKNKSLINYYRG